MIFAAGLGLDAATDIDRPGMQLAHRATDVVCCQTSRHHDRISARDLPGLRPRPGSTGTAHGVRYPGVKQWMVAVFEGDGGQVFPVLHAEGRKEQQAERAILLGQRPVDLDRREATVPRDLADLLRGLIDEHTDPFHGQFDIVGPGVPADLDLRHDPLSSRTLASRSAARSNDSPTSIASTPRRRSSSTSARLSMPLSLITTGPAGMRDRNRAVVCLSVFIALRSRLLMPMMPASHRRARS